MGQLSYSTPGGIRVVRTASKAPYKRGLAHLLRRLDTQRGAYLSSGYEYPERYSRWDIASVCPPLEIIGRGRRVEFRPLNARGEIICGLLDPVLAPHPHWESFNRANGVLTGTLKPLPKLFSEEERSRQPTAFSILRARVHELRHADDSRLGLIGAFGYDLLFQFDPVQLRLPREDRKDLHLFLCDEIWFMDRKKEQIECFRYDFERDGVSTWGLPRDGEPVPAATPREPAGIVSDHTTEDYVRKVEAVREGMRQGDYYEVVLRQTYDAPYTESPSQLFARIQQ